jgi:hypothetical protein
MSARLFASFTLFTEATSEERPTRRGKSTKGILCLLNLFQAIVHAEITSLGRQVENRKVQFAAFDGSSTKPPKDSVIGSHIPREASIRALEQALKEVYYIIDTKCPKDEIIICLKLLINFLANFRGRVGNDENELGASLRRECAKAMPFVWHAERFKKPASMYHYDMTKILDCIEKNKPFAQIEGSIQLEEQLVLSLSQGIRFHLRRFFNPIYFKVSVSPELDDKSLENCNTRLSKVSEMLAMKLPEGYNPGNDSAVADGSIASIFCLALQAVYQYFGNALFLDESYAVPDVPDAFCKSSASLQGLGCRKKSVEFTEYDIEEVLRDIFEAQNYLTAAKACRFLLELTNWPGVKEEIQTLGGWGIIENYAASMKDNNLSRLSPADSHFVVLSKMDCFLQRTEKCWEIMKPAVQASTEALDEVWKKLECGSTNRQRRMRYPQIAIIEDFLNEGLKMHMFPSISEPSSSKEDSD